MNAASSGRSAVAVILAGGASRRYGSDKLAAIVDGEPLLDRCLAGLAADRRVIIVGPDRAVRTGGRAVSFCADDHPLGGPAAALITGLRAALNPEVSSAGRGAGGREPELIMVIPGDAPQGGDTAERLLAELHRADLTGVIAVDEDGREQPLQLVITAEVARRMLDSTPEGGAHRSARSLIAPLGLTPVALGARAVYDIDTPEQHRHWVTGGHE